jgi:hypothetical protein
MTNAAFVIRFHYPEHDPRFEWRIAYFQSLVLPRILGQTDQDFDIAIWCNPWHRSRVEALSRRIRVFGVTAESEDFVRPEDRERARKFHIDFKYWKDIVGLPEYEIQIGLDSDDLIRSDYLERIRKEFDRWPDGSAHICFQPLVFNIDNLTQYDYKPRYTTENGSPFFAIRQRDTSSYIFAYEYSHLQLPRLFAQTAVVEPGYCWFTIHGANASTRLLDSSDPILNP